MYRKYTRTLTFENFFGWQGALLSAFLTAAIRGQIGQLIAYQEEEAETDEAPKATVNTALETKKAK